MAPPKSGSLVLARKFIDNFSLNVFFSQVGTLQEDQIDDDDEDAATEDADKVWS